VIPEREQLLQLARLAGIDAFTQRFGPPHAARPDAGALEAFVNERLAEIAAGLVAEAAASDDVTDVASATSYLDDRLTTLAGVLTAAQADAIRADTRERISDW
jgi:hypothetical protein